jgi:hypothetical protein
MTQLPWADTQFVAVTTVALSAFLWLLWPTVRASVKGTKPGAPPCARCAAGAAASCAKSPVSVAQTPRDADGTPLVAIGGRRARPSTP